MTKTKSYRNVREMVRKLSSEDFADQFDRKLGEKLSKQYEALCKILWLAQDKRTRVLASDQCAWLEKKMRAVAKLAKRVQAVAIAPLKADKL